MNLSVVSLPSFCSLVNVKWICFIVFCWEKSGMSLKDRKASARHWFEPNNDLSLMLKKMIASFMLRCCDVSSLLKN